MLLSHSFAKILHRVYFGGKKRTRLIFMRLLHAIKINVIKPYNVILNVNVAGMGQTTRQAMYIAAGSCYLLLQWKSKTYYVF